jgi:hypothetical protein
MGVIAATMVTKCANPSCTTTLLSFSEGRFFSFEIVSISIAANDDNSSSFDEKPRTQSLQYWLCGSCASQFSLVLSPARGLKLVPAGSEGAEYSDSLTPQPGDQARDSQS